MSNMLCVVLIGLTMAGPFALLHYWQKREPRGSISHIAAYCRGGQDCISLQESGLRWSNEGGPRR